MTYGTHRDHPPIEILTLDRSAWRVVAVTTWAATCDEAKAAYLTINPKARVLARWKESTLCA